jgi:hypothetical protein
VSGNRIRIIGQLDDKISSGLAKIRDDFDRLGTSKGAQSLLMGVGMEVGRRAFDFLANSVGDVVGYLRSSVDAASDLNETINKGREIFGSGAAAVEAWADKASRAFGQSKRQAIDTAAEFANVFRNVGLEENAQAFSMRLTELGSDLASFFNTDVQTALDSLQSGLAGQAIPLRKFGIFLTETQVAAKAAAMGFERVNGQFSEGAKVAARYQLILEQTRAAQGDFARTSDGLANSSRTVAAELENLSAEVGQVLLPVVTQLMVVARDDLIPTLRDVVQWAKDNAWAFDLLGRTVAFVTGGPMGAARHDLEEIVESHERAAAAADEQGQSLVGLAGLSRPSIAAVRRHMAEVAAQAEETRNAFWRAMDDIVAKLAMSRKDMQRIVNESLDAIYQPELDRIRLQAIEYEKAEQRKVLADTNATAVQKLNAQARLLELEKEARGLTTVLQLTGELAVASTNQTKALVADWAKAGPEARRQIDLTINRLAELVRLAEKPILANFSTVGRTGSGFTMRARGGPIEAGRPYIVGEEGPELFVSRERGYIVPNDRLAGTPARTAASGAPVVIQLALDGQRVAEVVDRHLYYRQ